MNRSRILFVGIALLAADVLLLPRQASAQGEVLTPLQARPVPEAVRALRKADGLNEHFIYLYEPQTLPIVDDFSIDRTRKRWAQATDPGVTLEETIYRLEVAGVSTWDMVFSDDTTFTYLTDLDPVPPVTTRTPLAPITVLVRDITVYPPTDLVVEAWPAYNIFDTIQEPSPDILFLASPELIQDSLLVYQVPAAPGTYTNPDNSVRPLVLWEDDDVYINGNYPIEPPTIGVATFDGLARTGYPYDYDQFTAYGIADHLTSVDIDLSAPLGPEDSLYLSFFYQPQGLSGDNAVQPLDSLVLEFWAPQLQYWSRVWSTPYVPLQGFQQVLVPIKLAQFFYEGFKFRFLNYGTLSGSYDHWHLDYVRLDQQRSFDDTRLIDVAYMYPETSLLQTYTSVTFEKFAEAPSTYMAQSITALQRNLDTDDRFITYGMLAREENGNGPVAFSNGLNSSGNASSIFPSDHPIAAAPNNFEYDPALSTDAAFWRVKLWTNTTPDICKYNDTVTFVQEISNYMAYDDGSAEMGYGITAAGAAAALRFDISGQDSLRAVRMYFNPQANDPNDSPNPEEGRFLITVWKSLSPEVIQHQNFTFSSPTYRLDGIDHFVEIPLDSTIMVEGTIYVGWVQTNNVKLNVGFDRNRNNQDKLFRRLTLNFGPSTQQGSLMLRPVFVAAVDPFASVPEETDGPGMLLFPNPANEVVMARTSIQLEGARLMISDAMGRIVSDERFKENRFVDVSALANGLYVARLSSADGALIAQERLLIQR
ncbi:MAG: T9SS type A sorting domain-containing protein [Flavobacteriales bacterium]|nr:T9SS type A sorting domain-containing protein [Flavobacteriales bacterium]